MTSKKLQIVDQHIRDNIRQFNRGKAIVLAPAGCGKTELLIDRLKLAPTQGIQPEEMLCITFTNRAAFNMRKRANIEEDGSIFVGNFHQFARTFLRKNQLISNSTKLLDEEDTKLLYDDVLEKLRKDHTFQELATAFKDTQNSIHKKIENAHLYYLQIQEGIPPVGWTIQDLPTQEQRFAFLLEKISERLSELKKRFNCLDFNDLLIELTKTLLTLKNDPEAKHKIKYMTQYRWIQIDEVQDLNPLQWRIIRLLTEQAEQSQQECVMLFGDYQQSIYSFLNANHALLDEHRQNFTEFKLQNNFRSDSTLVDIFNTYTKNAFGKVDWRLNIDASTQSSVEDHRLAIIQVNGNMSHEIERITKNLYQKGLLSNDENVGILVRANKQANLIGEILDNLKVPFFKMSGTDLFKRALVKDAFAFAELVLNPNDWLAWSRLWGSFGLTSNFSDAKDRIYELLQLGFSFEEYLKYHDGFKTLNAVEQIVHQERVVVFDTETTGLSFEHDLIIQIAGIEVIQGKVGQIFERYIKIDRPVGQSEAIHKISDKMLDEMGVDVSTAFNDFIAFVGESKLFAHNANFDINMLENHFKRLNIEWRPSKVYDTLTLARQLYPYASKHKLEYLIKYLDLPEEFVNSHNAIDDVKATAEVLIRMMNHHQFDLSTQNNKHLKGYLTKFDEKLRPLCEPVFFHKMKNYSIKSLFEFYFRVAVHQNNKEYQKNFDEIKDMLPKLYKDMDNRFPDYLSPKLLRTILQDYMQKQEADLISDSDKIVVSTVHKAKGLEFHTVYIPACNDEVSYPNFQSAKSPDQIEEEKRLFYVALTRSRKNIVISYHTKFNKHPKHASPFLSYLDLSKFKSLNID